MPGIVLFFRRRRFSFWWLLAGLLCGCQAEPSPVATSRQQELRERFELEPRVALPLPQLAERVRQDNAGIDEYCDLAGAMALRGEFTEAIEVYRHAVVRFPDGVRALYNLGQIYARTGQYDLAIQQWERTLKLVPDFADACFHLGVAHAQRAPTAIDQPANLNYVDLDKAIEYCTCAVELESDNAFFYFNLARALQLRHRYEEAAGTYRRALELDPALIEAHRFVGELYIKQGDWENARKAYTAVVRLDSTDAHGNYQLGKVLVREEHFAEAAARFERAVALKPHFRDAFYNLARVYRRLGRMEDEQRALARFEELAEDDAVEAARARVQRMPHRAVERRALAVAYVQAGEYQKALEELQVTRVLAPEQAGIYHDLGLVYDKMGDLANAVLALRKAVSLEPDTARFHLRLGQAYAKAGREELAENAFRRAVELTAGWSQAEYELGMLLLRRRKAEEAQRLFMQLLQREPAYQEARFGLCLTYLDLGRYREAATQLEILLERRPDYPRGQELLVAIREKIRASAAAP